MTESSRFTSKFGGRRAVVIGGSMAGLVAGRTLSSHFDDVVIVERDPIPDNLAEARKGVPQGHHLHALLARGGQALEQLFPGFIDGAMADGALLIDWGNDLIWYHFGGWKVRMHSNVSMLCLSRPLLEAHVRRRLFSLPNVRRLDHCDVTGLLSTPDRRQLTGVAIQRRARAGEHASINEQLKADVVVEASGRGSKLPSWLEAMGYGRPPETSVRVNVGYASRIYRSPDPGKFGWRAMYVLGAPPESRRLGAIFPMEGNRVIAALGGLLSDYPPDDPKQFMEFARTLPSDALAQALSQMDPLSEISTYRFSSHQRRHYERMQRLPEGLIVIGDALASFNPIYGQGMTTACLEAQTLDACLAAQHSEIQGLSRRYQDAAARIAATPWMLATGEDFRYPEVQGLRPTYYPVLRWYTSLVHKATRVDAKVYERFIRVMHMLDGPERLFDPRVIWRVLAGAKAVEAAQSNYAGKML